MMEPQTELYVTSDLIKSIHRSHQGHRRDLHHGKPLAAWMQYYH